MVAVVLAGDLGVVLALRSRYLPNAVVLPGLAIDGERVPSGADVVKVRAMIEAHADALSQRQVQLVATGHSEPVAQMPLGDLGVRVDVDNTLQSAMSIGKSGSVFARAKAANAARAGHIDVALRTVVDRDVARPLLEKIKKAEDSEPVSARLDLTHLDSRTIIPEKEGRSVDVEGTMEKIDASVHEPIAGSLVIEMPTVAVAPRITSAWLSSLDIGTVVAGYDTYFSRGGDQKKRGKNIDNAAKKLNGLVILPGEQVSFNDVVGERSEANGFQKSWEIYKGEMVEGIGGGTCQVASTFHAAAFFAGFEVIERLPHSRPSAYIPMGLDSTVVYPEVDLKVRNPYDFPIVVHTKTEGGKLHIELLGKTHPVDVSFGRELVATVPYKRKIVQDSTLSGNKVLVKQHGINGFRIKRSRLLKSAGHSKKEVATDFYPPTTEIYHVPVGFDVSMLPPLPGGEDNDSNSDGSVASAAASVQAPDSAKTTTCVDCTNAKAATEPEGVEFVNGPGAHAPTNAQANPAKTIWVNRH